MSVGTRPGGQQADEDDRSPEVVESDTTAEDGSARDSQSAPGLTRDDVFDILRNSRRRSVISYLLETGGSATVTELTEHIASQEYDVEVDDLTSEQYKRVYTALHQCHLPRLEKFDVVHTDADDETVVLDDAVARLRGYLHQSNGFIVRVEVTVAAVVATLVVAGVVGFGPLGSVSVVWWSVLTVAALLGVAVLQLYGTRRSNW